MIPSRATLLTLVQCRSMWFWHLWGAAICLTVLISPLISRGARSGVVFSMLVVPFWSGVISASLCKDLLTKPFSFCVPRHAKAWRVTLFKTGLVVAAVCALVVLFSTTGAPGVVAVTVWQTFVICLGAFMLAALVTTSAPNTGFLPALITILLIITFNDNLAEHVRVTVEDVLLAHPLVTTVTCAMIVYAAWRKLGSRDLSRRLCGEAFLGLHGSFNSQTAEAYKARRKLHRMRRSPGRLMKTLERFVTARMQARSGRATLKALWGTLYVQTGKWAPATASNFVWLFLFLVMLTLVLGFYHPHRLAPGVSGANLILFLACLVNADYRVNPYAGLLLNVSRKNRYTSLVFSALTQWLVLGVFAAALTAVSIAAGRFVDELTVAGGTYTYTPVHPKAFFIFAPAVPFYFLSQVLFPKRHVIAIMVISIAGVIGFFAIGHKMLDLSVLWLLLLQLVSWLPFIGWIRHYCYSWDLTLNGQ